jgi:glycosyltransferase involved in cell wall biosynthesis
MTEPLISCIIGVYNGERYLREALDSILAQTYRPLEIIVADDGSTDSTAEVVAGYGKKVRYLWQPNAGPAAARNLGICRAPGDFIAFLDADDVWHPEKLTRQMACFEARPELELCVTHIQNFWIPELHEKEARFRDHRISQPAPGYLTQTLVARRALFDTVGYFNSALKHGGDTDWFMRAAEHGAVMELLQEVLVYRRLHWTNMSLSEAAASRDEYVRIIKASLDRRRCGMGTVPRFYNFLKLNTKRDA